VDQRSDLFSLGVLLYEMATGHLPFPGNTAAEIFNALLSHTPVPPRSVNAGVPPKLQEIILKALEKDRSLRYQNASGVRADLERLVRDAREKPRKALPLMSLVAAAVVVIAGVGWLWHRSSRERWALETAMPEIARLVEEREFQKAAALTREARAVLPKDPTLEKLWMRATAEFAMESEPRGRTSRSGPTGGMRTAGRVSARRRSRRCASPKTSTSFGSPSPDSLQHPSSTRGLSTGR
jgi:hypothetical protein